METILYVVKDYYDHESEMVHGVFSSEAHAQYVIDNVFNNKYDLEIVELTLDEYVEEFRKQSKWYEVIINLEGGNATVGQQNIHIKYKDGFDKGHVYNYDLEHFRIGVEASSEEKAIEKAQKRLKQLKKDQPNIFDIPARKQQIAQEVEKRKELIQKAKDRIKEGKPRKGDCIVANSSFLDIPALFADMKHESLISRLAISKNEE